MQAVQALGLSMRPEAWPILEQVHQARRPLPDGFYSACYNLQDRRAVPIVMAALDDPDHLDDAVMAAASLLALAAVPAEYPAAIRAQ